MNKNEIDLHVLLHASFIQIYILYNLYYFTYPIVLIFLHSFIYKFSTNFAKLILEPTQLYKYTVSQVIAKSSKCVITNTYNNYSWNQCEGQL